MMISIQTLSAVEQQFNVYKPTPQEYYIYCGVGILPAHIIFNCAYLLTNFADD
jgi:hypothetical protein